MHRKIMRTTGSIVLLLICLFQIGGADASFPPEAAKKAVDFKLSTLKLLAADFYVFGDDVFLCAGTESAISPYEKNSPNRFFIYHVNERAIEFTAELENSISMTAICDAGNEIYFGSIAVSQSDGCNLYKYNKETKECTIAAHIQERGIYSLAYSRENRLILIGTSDRAALYQYDISKETTVYLSSFGKKYIRSIGCGDDKAFLGLGTPAELIEYDLRTGAYRSVYPNGEAADSFVYDISVSSGTHCMYMLVTPSGRIMKSDLTDRSPADTGIFFRDDNDLLEGECSDQYSICSLLGNILYLDGQEIKGRAQYGNLQSFVHDGTAYGIDSSGILHIIRNGSKESVDLFQYIESGVYIPNHYTVYNDVIYVPARRFYRYDLSNGVESTFLVNDEPQAMCFDEKGLYTANYTECTVYFYPWETLSNESYTVEMNNKQYLLIDIDDQCRPFDLFITNGGDTLLIASGAEYGQYGGSLSSFSLAERTLNYQISDIVPNQKIVDIARCGKEGCVWLGTSTFGENTKPESIDAAPCLVLWNYIEKTAEKTIEFSPGDYSICSIKEDDRNLYMQNHYGHLLVIDKEDFSVIYRDDIPWRGIFEYHGVTYFYRDQEIDWMNGQMSLNKLISDSFTNLNGITVDELTNKIYAFDGSALIELSISKTQSSR